MDIANVIDQDNVATSLDDAKLDEIAKEVITGFETDEESRHDWLEKEAS